MGYLGFCLTNLRRPISFNHKILYETSKVLTFECNLVKPTQLAIKLHLVLIFIFVWKMFFFCVFCFLDNKNYFALSFITSQFHTFISLDIENLSVNANLNLLNN